MKKLLLISVVVTGIMLTGCAQGMLQNAISNAQAQAEQNTQAPQPQTTAAPETAAPNTPAEQATQAPSAVIPETAAPNAPAEQATQAPPTMVPENAAPNVADTTATITEEEAKTIALGHAGVSESDTQYLFVGFEYDDFRAIYDVDFVVETTEYNFEIDANSGQIVEYDAESIYD